MHPLSTISHLCVTWCMSTAVAAGIAHSDTTTTTFDFNATTTEITLPQVPEREVSVASISPPPRVPLSTPLLLSSRQQRSPVEVRIQEGSTVQGWPTLLEIEVDELELGGLTMPSIQSVIQNLKIGSKNFGNVDAPTSSLT